MDARRRLLLFRRPSRYDFDFRNAAMPAGALLTRASTGWRTNAAGVIVPALSDVERFTYNGNTLALEGLLEEMVGTNGLLRSQEFDNGSWGKVRIALSANTTVAPDGTTTADMATEDATAADSHAFYQQVTLAADTYTALSVFFKAGTRTKCYVNLLGTTDDWATAIFDTTTGAMTQSAVGATTGTIQATQIQALGNGWWRGSLEAKVLAANPYCVFGFAPLATGNTFNTFGGAVYNGDGVSNGHFWQADLGSAGVGVTSSIPTTNAAVTRAADVLTLALPNGTYRVDIHRLSGLTTVAAAAVTAGSYTVPTDTSPLQRVVARRIA